MATEKRKPYEYVDMVPEKNGKDFVSINGKDYNLLGGAVIPIRKDHLPNFKAMGVKLNKAPKK